MFHLYRPRPFVLSKIQCAKFQPPFFSSLHPSPNGASPQKLFLTSGLKDCGSPVLAAVDNPGQSPHYRQTYKVHQTQTTQLLAAWKVQEITSLACFLHRQGLPVSDLTKQHSFGSISIFSPALLCSTCMRNSGLQEKHFGVRKGKKSE